MGRRSEWEGGSTRFRRYYAGDTAPVGPLRAPCLLDRACNTRPAVTSQLDALLYLVRPRRPHAN